MPLTLLLRSTLSLTQTSIKSVLQFTMQTRGTSYTLPLSPLPGTKSRCKERAKWSEQRHLHTFIYRKATCDPACCQRCTCPRAALTIRGVHWVVHLSLSLHHLANARAMQGHRPFSSGDYFALLSRRPRGPISPPRGYIWNNLQLELEQGGSEMERGDRETLGGDEIDTKGNESIIVCTLSSNMNRIVSDMRRDFALATRRASRRI